MTDDATFAAFVARVRAGDAAAADELVKRYEPAVRVVVRARLGDGGLRRQFDSMDVCQSVMGTFFARAAAGQFDLRRPDDLLGLLAAIARNKLNEQVRFHRRDRRDDRRTAPADEFTPAAGPPPDRVAEGRELLAALRARLTPEERDLADRRADGQEWAAIAEALGGTADGRRKQLARAVDRVAPGLGLADAGDE